MNELFETLKYFEGCVPHLYKDANGGIKAGVGFVLPHLVEAQLLVWDLPGHVRLDWAAVAQAPAGKKMEYYRKLTRARLLDVDSELAKRTSRLLPTWALSLPTPARMAAMDIAYNVGSLVTRPNLCAALRARDFKLAADESFRSHVSHERNVWTALRFLKAGDL